MRHSGFFVLAVPLMTTAFFAAPALAQKKADYKAYPMSCTKDICRVLVVNSEKFGTIQSKVIKKPEDKEKLQKEADQLVKDWNGGQYLSQSQPVCKWQAATCKAHGL